MRKDGGRFDLAIALGILAASGQIPYEPLRNLEILGELSLSGELRAVHGALPAALKAHAAGHGLLVPQQNAREACLATDIHLYTADHLSALCAALHADTLARTILEPAPLNAAPEELDLAQVRGQQQAKRALEIAAAGGHSILMLGPPGSGKSMLAQRLPGLLPPLTEAEAIEVAAVASIGQSGFQLDRHWRKRPFRNPHHTASAVALVGGGSGLQR